MPSGFSISAPNTTRGLFLKPVYKQSNNLVYIERQTGYLMEHFKLKFVKHIYNNFYH